MEGTRLGDYTLIKQVGQGSLGTLFLAEHRFTKKRYALKVLPEELVQDKTFCHRFEEEVASIAAIDHPNIVKVNTVSFVQGLYVLTEDFIVNDIGESMNLWHYFCSHKHTVTEEWIFGVAQQLAQALDWAHERKYVHRGIKWNNILIGPVQKEDRFVRVYLSDFGLSKLIGQGVVLSRSFKAFAEALAIAEAVGIQRIGNDRYAAPAPDAKKLSQLHTSFLQNMMFLAPEQKKDGSGEREIDVYAFGVLLYYLLTETYPDGLFSMPSEKRRQELGAFKYDWDLIITECLYQDPKKRASSLLELLLQASYKDQEAVQEPQQNVSQILIKKLQEQSIDPVFEVNQEVISTCQFDLFPEIHTQQPLLDVTSQRKTVQEYQPERREVRVVKPLATDMVVIDGDAYLRGSNQGCRDEMPRHTVQLEAFAIDVHPVTNEQFVRFLEFLGEEKDAQNHDIVRLKDCRIKKSAGRYSIEPGYAKHPVVGVTWYGACAYARWIGKRLPSEAEWEIACCGSLEDPLYPTGDTIEKNQANFFNSDTTAVMSYPPNSIGIYDLAGNVYEWCQDWYDYNFYETASQEPDAVCGPMQGVYRVLRGGCWKSLKEDLRCAKRHRNNPGAANATYGFRCAAIIENAYSASQNGTY